MRQIDYYHINKKGFTVKFCKAFETKNKRIIQ